MSRTGNRPATIENSFQRSCLPMLNGQILYLPYLPLTLNRKSTHLPTIQAQVLTQRQPPWWFFFFYAFNQTALRAFFSLIATIYSKVSRLPSTLTVLTWSVLACQTPTRISGSTSELIFGNWESCWFNSLFRRSWCSEKPSRQDVFWTEKESATFWSRCVRLLQLFRRDI